MLNQQTVGNRTGEKNRNAKYTYALRTLRRPLPPTPVKDKDSASKTTARNKQRDNCITIRACVRIHEPGADRPAPGLRPAEMPNGHRQPYRVSSGKAPSPAHSSDSEETWSNKRVFWWRRMGQTLLRLRLLPERLREPEVAEVIAAYLR